MAVLVEGISVIVRLDAIRRKVRGSWGRFLKCVPNSTLCYDQELARVGFLHPDEVGLFIDHLESIGLVSLEDGQPADFAVVDQQTGPVQPCKWLEFTRFRWGKEQTPGKEKRVGTCWLWDKPRFGSGTHMSEKGIKLHTPPGWKFEGSLSHKFTFTPHTTGLN